jgi:GTPase SAR1 family protein
MSNNNSNLVNICLVGCVSAGKSTILNAFFCQEYAQCKIKRTTMMPNIFIETNDLTKIDSFANINKKISNVNEQIYNQTENMIKPLNLDNFGGELSFHVEEMQMNVGNKIKICIYDIPGLNDAKTKKIYYNYLEKNFHKFNIILFVVDIKSGLNTSDEMDILNFLAANINKHKKDSNKNINMLTIVNKADDMQLKSNGELEVLGELGEMFDQTNNTVKQVFNKYKIDSNSITCIPICGLDAHLYRMIKKHGNINGLSREHILKIGVNDEGSKFRSYSENIQRNKILQIINNNQFVENMINLSGFSQIETCLKKYINSNGSKMISENILYEYSKLPELKIDGLVNIVRDRIILISKIKLFDLNKYNEEMRKLVKQMNTIIYKKINELNNPNEIKIFFDDQISKIKSNNNIRTEIFNFFDLNTYPSYFTDRILELVINEYSMNLVPVSKLSYIELFENIGNLKVEIIDLILDSLLSNPKGTNTFVFDNGFGPGFGQKIIKLFEKLNNSNQFIQFIRFFLANMYTNLTKPEDLVLKILLFRKYSEIPLYEFICDLRNEKKIIDTNKQNKMYCQGINNNNSKDNILELYYIHKCRELNDNDNFISHDKKITIDFNMIY